MIEQLYKIKIIRDFLSLYSDTKWKDLISLVLEYGILNLRKNHNVGSLSLEDLAEINEILKEETNKKYRNYSPKVTRLIPNQHFERSEMSSNGRATSEPTKDRYKLQAFKAPSQWRKGDEILFVKKSITPFINSSKENSSKFIKFLLTIL